MELKDAIIKRRSTRRYTGERIPDESIEEIINAGLMAPSSRGFKPCEYYVVRDKELLKALSEAKAMGARMLADCDTAIVVATDSEKADTWIEDGSISLAYMDLTACSVGVGCCWTQYHLRFDKDGGMAEDNVRKILDIPEKYRIVGALSLGMPGESHEPNEISEEDIARVHRL
ncbi:MAG: nitroreductase family protein [Firmicutes bacterium]|nr:nitroreductase family protein [Bacillota bacterium]